MKKIMALILAVLFALTSCAQNSGGEGNNVKTEELTDFSQYRVIMTSDYTDITVGLVDEIQEKTGVRLALAYDKTQDGGKEILIGNTNRKESEFSGKYADFVIKKQGDKIVVNGGSKNATAKAVEWFLKNCVSDTLKVPDNYTYSPEYPLEKVKLNGVLISEYAADGSDKLKEALANATGVYPPETAKNTFKTAFDENISSLEVKLTSDGKDLTLTLNENGLGEEYAVSVISEELKKLKDGDKVDITKTMATDNIKIIDETTLKEWRDKTDNRIKEIKNTPNTQIPSGANVYYVSSKGNDSNNGKTPDKAWRTLEKLNSETLSEGSFVLFERGGLWRGQIKAQKGVTYSAYGEGEKPLLYASPVDGAKEDKWVQTSNPNVWYYDMEFEDVGSLVFNDGEAHAVRYYIRKNKSGATEFFPVEKLTTGVEGLDEDLTFVYHSDKKVYLYSKENPAKRFNSIEFLIKPYIISISVDNVTVDNLHLKYTGGHGIGAGTVKNLTVQNCEFSWIGGSTHYIDNRNGLSHPVRYGNAVQIYGGCENYTVNNNRFYQTYDAAATHQYNMNDAKEGADYSMINIKYTNNVMEYSNYSIEWFLGNVPSGNKSVMRDVLVENNLMWYAGEGLSSQRDDKNEAAHIKSWGHHNPGSNVTVKDNLMAYTTVMQVHLFSINEEGVGRLSNNTFIAKSGVDFGVLGTKNDRYAYSPKTFEEKSNYCTNNTYYYAD